MNVAPHDAPRSDPDDHARLRRALDRAAHHLPAQGPIGVFVHHNPLHAFEHLPFDDAVADASERFDAEPYLPLARYRAHFASGRVRPGALAEALRARREGRPARAVGPFDLDRVDEVLLHRDVALDTARGIRWELEEHAAARRLPEAVPADDRARFITRSLRHLLALIADYEHTGDFDAFAARLGDARAVRAVFEEPLTPGAFRAMASHAPERLAVGALWCRCLAAAPADPAPGRPPLADRVGRDRTFRDLMLALTGEDAIVLVHWALIRASASYLDLGVALWPMPRRDRGFYRAWRDLMLQPAVVPAWLAGLRAELLASRARDLSPADAAVEILHDLGVAPEHWDTFVERVLLQLPGWAGMMRRLERHPDERPADCGPASLLDFFAVRLTLDRFAWRHLARQHFGPAATPASVAAYAQRHPELAERSDDDAPLRAAWRLFELCQHLGVTAGDLAPLDRDVVASVLAEVRAFDDRARRRVWHDAYEISHRDEVLGGLAANLRRATEARDVAAPALQLVTCIDDREESFRRAFEALSPAHETFGAAGFFGVAFRFKALDAPEAVALCPVNVAPAHTVTERPHPDDRALLATRRARLRALARAASALRAGARSFLRGLALAAPLGLLAAVPLVGRVLFPHASGRARRAVARAALPAPRTTLDDARDVFTLDEQVDRVAGTLTALGLTGRFAPLVAVLGHGASTANNPHHSAYECGACGGREGGVNARLFAWMANRPEVRAGLRARGVEVPDGTHFLGGRHDTSTDAVELYDRDALPEGARAHLAALDRALDEARRASARERCRRFAHAAPDVTPDEALAHVEARADDLSQARPELGHVTNAVAVFGRRSLTRGLFLDRRAFLISYDAAVDDARASVLERVLSAAVPVCAGINLEYLFSCVDNDRYGCGTKLPHNLVGLLGVMNGAASDLRTGLPQQMIEIHEPVRLLVVVEATPALLADVVARAAAVRDLATHAWIRLVSAHPDTGELALYSPAGFTPWRGDADVPRVATAHAWYAGKRDFVGPAIVGAAP